MAINLGNTEYLGSSSRVGSAGYVSSQSAVSGASMLNPSSLKSGQTISGEVVAQDGNNVTLKLTNGQLLNARLDNNAGVVAGKMLSFEVSTGNNTIALRPLYANLNANSTISSALKAAGLPLTQTNIDMTKAMMQEGMSINRNALLDMARNVYTMPGSDPASIVQMVKIGLPIDELTVREFENYKNFEHQIINDVNDLSSEVSSLISDAISTGNGDSIGEVMQLMELIDAGNIEAEEAADAMQTSDSINALPENISSAVIDEQIIGQNELTEDLASGTTDAGALNMAEEPVGAKSAGIMDTIRDAISSKVNELVSTLNGDAAADNQSSVINAARDSVNDMNNSLKALADYLNVSFDENMSDPQKFQFIKDSIALLSSTKGENGVNAQLLSHIKNVIANDSTGKLIEKAVKSQLTLSPEKVAKDGAVDDLYNRILKISQKVVDMASQNPEHFAEAAKSAQNLQNNVNFMNQVNQFVNYVQLPLKMGGENAHGELYVYSDKKSLEEKGGSLTALLHLDMEHLGPMDVYVAMREYTNVTTNFKLADESTLNFIAENIELLNQRLIEKGYNVNSSFTVTDDIVGQGKSIADEFLKEEPGASPREVAMVQFDVRA